MRLLTSFFVASLVLATVPALAQDAPAAAPPSMSAAAAAPAHELTKTDVDSWLDGLVPFAIDKGDIPGAVVVIVKDGQILTSRGFGYADLAAHKPVDPATTMFRPGSVSKLFTWTAVMQLVEQGKLDLDADINQYLDFKFEPFDGKPITLRNCMTHTAGFEENGRGLVQDNTDFTLGGVMKERLPKQVYMPGTTPAYSNYATGLAGYIVERVSGEKFEEYVEKHILQPLKMAHTTFRQPLPDDLKPFMSQGYSPGSRMPKPFENVNISPAGGASAAGEDMGQFMIAHLHHGAGLMKPETADMMHTTPLTLMPQVNRMDLGFYEANRNGHKIIAHGGDLQWHHSLVTLLLDDDIGIFISYNSPGTGVGGSIRPSLVNGFMDRYFPAPKADRPHVDAKESAEHAKLMSGYYVSSRRNITTFHRATEFFSQQLVSVDDKGRLKTAQRRGGGEAIEWAEIAPFVWWDRETDTKLGAKVVDGKVVMWATDGSSPFTVSLPVPWYQKASWIRPATYAVLGILALTALFWPISALIRRNYGVTLALGGRDLTAYRAISAVSLLGVALFAGWYYVLTQGAPQVLHPSSGLIAIIYAVEIATFLIMPILILTSFWNAMVAWTGDRTLKARLWSVLIALGSLMLLWTAVVYNLFFIGIG